MDNGDQFRRLKRITGETGFETLQKSTVILFGVGGVGSWAAESLVRSGVVQITIVDSDEVALSNINRQMIALHSTLGKSKVEVLKERLLDINPNALISIHHSYYDAESAELFDLNSYDYVVDAIDSLSPKKLLIEKACSADTYFVSSMGAALKTDPMRVKIAPIHKTKGCGLAKIIRKDMHRKGLSAVFMTVYSEERLGNFYDEGEVLSTKGASKKQENGTFAHITAIFGNCLASLVINDCLDKHSILKRER